MSNYAEANEIMGAPRVSTADPEEVDFYEFPLESPRIHNISGRPGQGKTVLDFSLADRLHAETGKLVYVIISDRDKRIESYEGIPDHIRSFRGVLTMPQDSIIIGDDWQRIIHARRAMAKVNVTLDQELAVHRHNGQDFLIDTQTASSIDRNNVLRSNYRWYKEPLKKELQLGRPEIQTELELAKSMNLAKDEALVDFDDGMYKVTGIPLPEYWSEELSVLHRRQPVSQWEKAVKLI